MKIKQGDTVMIITGSDKKKTGKVLEVLKDKDMVVVAGVNIKKKVARDTNGTKNLVDVEYPVHVSNVKLTEGTKKATKKSDN